ncbi:unnamed protein product [Vicia faba]|uniref:Reverse transcriptase domain-containing protein n=1 Tax=Vicia faba TaxID=3906 RepID=A0AAV0YK82_VICFA|nr:unnamed protein product [Vicia faba]
MPLLVSPKKHGFIQGRKIHNCIALTLKAINLLDIKVWCGNITLKVYIAKAFDAISWSFLLEIMKNFKFNPYPTRGFKSFSVILVNPSLLIELLTVSLNALEESTKGDPLSP